MDATARFDGRTGVVTGAASGMGREVTRRLHAEGAAVVAVDLDGVGLRETLEPLGADRAWGIEADVTSEADTGSYVALALERTGRLDHFFNNAGIIGPVEQIAICPPEGFDQVIAVNLRGAFLGLRAVMREMLRLGSGGSIVSTASYAALRGTVGGAAYAAAKAGGLALMRSAALEGAAAGIRVNAIAPGPIDTPMLTRSLEMLDDASLDRSLFSSGVPMGRLGQPAEVAALVTWLLSDEASFVTGVCVPIDGGLQA